MLSLNPNKTARVKRGIRAWAGELKDGVLTIAPGNYFRDFDSGRMARERRKPRGKRFLIQGVSHDEIAAITIINGKVVTKAGSCRDGAVWVMERSAR